MVAKPLYWVGSARTDLRALPVAARRTAGFQLRRVQHGLDPDDWKPMQSIGPGVREIRVHTDSEHRVFYVARFEDAIYVLHAFQKRSRKTPKRDLQLARERLRTVLMKRRSTT